VLLNIIVKFVLHWPLFTINNNIFVTFMKGQGASYYGRRRMVYQPGPLVGTVQSWPPKVKWSMSVVFLYRWKSLATVNCSAVCDIYNHQSVD